MTTTYRPWSKEEDELIRFLARRGLPYKERAKFFSDRTQDAIRNRTWELRQQEYNHWLDDQRVGFLDIESSTLDANTGIMLSWCLKLKGGEILSDVIKRRECINIKRLDKRIVKNLIKALRAHVDVVVTYYGTRFDIPFVRTRALILGVDFIPYGEKKHIDLYYQVRAKLKLTRNRLATACAALGIVGKTPLDISVWNMARLGYPEALAAVLEHNIGDVEILEELYNRLRPFSKSTRKSL